MGQHKALVSLVMMFKYKWMIPSDKNHLIHTKFHRESPQNRLKRPWSFVKLERICEKNDSIFEMQRKKHTFSQSVRHLHPTVSVLCQPSAADVLLMTPIREHWNNTQNHGLTSKQFSMTYCRKLQNIWSFICASTQAIFQSVLFKRGPFIQFPTLAF